MTHQSTMVQQPIFVINLFSSLVSCARLINAFTPLACPRTNPPQGRRATAASTRGNSASRSADVVTVPFTTHFQSASSEITSSDSVVPTAELDQTHGLEASVGTQVEVRMRPALQTSTPVANMLFVQYRSTSDPERGGTHATVLKWLQNSATQVKVLTATEEFSRCVCGVQQQSQGDSKMWMCLLPGCCSHDLR